MAREAYSRGRVSFPLILLQNNAGLLGPVLAALKTVLYALGETSCTPTQGCDLSALSLNLIALSNACLGALKLCRSLQFSLYRLFPFLLEPVGLLCSLLQSISGISSSAVNRPFSLDTRK
jgi:hypothetical protein